MLFQCPCQSRLFASAIIGMENPPFDSFIDLAIRDRHSTLNGLHLFRSGVGGIGTNGGEITLHQRSHSGFVTLITKTVALSDFYTLDGRLDVSHRKSRNSTY